jgi:hypothetical protein
MASLHSVYKAEKAMTWAGYVPVVNVLLGQLQTLGVLANINHQPYQAYILASVLATQQLQFACYGTESYEQTLAESVLLPKRMLQENTGTAASPRSLKYASSRYFFIDFLLAFVWLVAGWLGLLVCRYCWPEYRPIAEGVLFRLHQAWLLLLSASLAANISDLSSGARIGGLVLGIVTILYYLGYLTYYTNRIYSLHLN